MKTIGVCKRGPAFLARLATLICLLHALSFGMVLQSSVTAKEKKPSDPEAVALRIANLALQNRDFNKALEGFKILTHSADDKIARKARYGLACLHLTLAESPRDVREALLLWDSWSEHAPSDLEDEDPRNLGPVIKSKILPKPKKIQIRKKEKSNEKSVLENRLQTKGKEIQSLTRRLKDMEIEIQTILKKHAEYVGVMEKEIQALRDKIKSLEAIDQKIKEKKKEVSSP
jgi:hypothetical protein